jgi:single-strand DNA-binding protein
MNFNFVCVAGNLTKTPELRTTNSGTSVCDLRLAVNTKRGQAEETLYIDVIAWGATAETCCKYLEKGRNIAVKGRLKDDSWENKDGQKVNKTVIVSDEVNFGHNPNKPQAQLETEQETTAAPF